MTNSVLKAAQWTEFLAGRAEFPAGDRLTSAFRAGTITRLCDCGCNSFDILVPVGSVEPLVSGLAGAGGAVFEMDFRTRDGSGTVELVVFVDDAGNFEGLDVDFCGNSAPMPESPVLEEQPFHVQVHDALEV